MLLFRVQIYSRKYYAEHLFELFRAIQDLLTIYGKESEYQIYEHSSEIITI